MITVHHVLALYQKRSHKSLNHRPNNLYSMVNYFRWGSKPYYTNPHHSFFHYCIYHSFLFCTIVHLPGIVLQVLPLYLHMIQRLGPLPQFMTPGVSWLLPCLGGHEGFSLFLDSGRKGKKVNK